MIFQNLQIYTAKLLLLLNVGVFGVIVVLSLLFSKGNGRVVVLGWICVGFSVFVFVAPLSIIVSHKKFTQNFENYACIHN